MEISNFGIFVIATFILNITPGNDFIFVATQSISKGTKAGIVSSVGISLGLLVHISASVLGLSVLLSKSIIAFEVIKWLGAAYLIYLGIRSILASSKSLDSTVLKDNLSTKRLLRQGFLTNVFNPKVALFFLSFLPQFADSSSPYFSLQLKI
ncbi:MAG: LysE family translocator, partial [Ignavibacteriaceae bacterium]